jgi:predicted 3-demethylubiquinone-9 3-methyltransferase (glyoxalase superfamily)
MSELTPCLWFSSGDGMEALTRYVEIFSRYGESHIVDVSYYPGGGAESPGTELVVTALLDGQKVMALNGGAADFAHSPAFSMSISCDGAEQVDHYWDSLVDGGEPGRCGWLVDRWGISWQVVPRQLGEYMSDPDPEKSQRTAAAMMTMSKLDVEALRAARDGVGSDGS